MSSSSLTPGGEQIRYAVFEPKRVPLGYWPRIQDLLLETFNDAMPAHGEYFDRIFSANDLGEFAARQANIRSAQSTSSARRQRYGLARAVVAHHEDRLVGYLQVANNTSGNRLISKAKMSIPAYRSVWTRVLGVTPEMQRQGIATHLIEAAMSPSEPVPYSYCPNQPATAYVYAGNHKAQAFWRQLGYQPAGGALESAQAPLEPVRFATRVEDINFTHSASVLAGNNVNGLDNS